MDMRCPDCDTEVNDMMLCPLCGKNVMDARPAAPQPARYIRNDQHEWALELMGVLIAAVEACPQEQPALLKVYEWAKDIAEGEV